MEVEARGSIRVRPSRRLGITASECGGGEGEGGGGEDILLGVGVEAVRGRWGERGEGLVLKLGLGFNSGLL